jgi:phosphatidylserine decarboxylase
MPAVMGRGQGGAAWETMPIAREGWPYILALVVLGALLWMRWPWVGLFIVALGLFTAYFFRDPERTVPAGDRLVVSPADGKVVQIVPASVDGPLGAGAVQVSVFLSIFNVHINRAPVAGQIEEVKYNKGSFLPAFDDKASLRNEQNCVTISGASGRVAFKQIAGLIARRIVFTKQRGDTVGRGERLGLIKFGSRVDVLLPAAAELRVKVGDRVVGGETVVAALPGAPE